MQLGTLTTVNGWPVLGPDTDGPFPRLRRFAIPGTGRALTLRDGAVGFLIALFALWWDERIERLDTAGDVWDEWGHAVRPVRGQSSGYSNHAGGAAADLNATRHPMGVAVSRTFTPAQIRRIRRRLLLFRGCLVWGGVWSRPDGMHVEAARTLAACERVARVLMHTPRGRRVLAANPGLRKAILS